jgi:cyclophilin family peptidyl-prolyl cis-trans isomerase
MLILFSCTQKSETKKELKKPVKKVETLNSKKWMEIIPSLAKIESFDGERILESGQGFFVDTNLFVTKYSIVSKANNAYITPYNENKKYSITEFVAFDRINDLIILKVNGINKKPIQLFSGTTPKSAKSIYISRPTSQTIPLRTGKVLSLSNVNGVNLYRISNPIRNGSFGSPVFVSNKKVIGIVFSKSEQYELRSFAIPSIYISNLLNKTKKPKTLKSLSAKSDKAVAISNRLIKSLHIETDIGNISIRLFNETAAYRDNFIKLAREGYYDSLLIHRVIRGFGIQSGAADTRYATKDDVVGWKGPGYSIPAHIIPKYFHKRGMIGSPRKPDGKNQKRRSDGSQFYIVSGRIYNDSELDDLEEENNYKFSAQQRHSYKTIGGAPHIDGTYTVFGEVISGMNIVDIISRKETDRDFRPINDIRIKKITIVE